MNLQDVKERLKRKNKILFAKDSPCLQELAQLIQTQNRRTLVLWALECAEKPAEILNRHYPDDMRPRFTIDLAWDWAAGKIKMPQAKQAILQVHAMAKELTNPADIARCHAVGQACSVVHTPGHAMGLPIYELTAIVREQGIECCEAEIAAKISAYAQCLKQCQRKNQEENYQWAKFLQS